MDTTKLTLRECNVWSIANQEDDPGDIVPELLSSNHIEIPTFTYHVDGSWKHDETPSGVAGFYIYKMAQLIYLIYKMIRKFRCYILNLGI